MNICVIGAGAIGGFLAVKLACSGQKVSVVARGAHLTRIQADGLRLIENDRETVARITASDRLSNLGEQDLIVLGVKAHQITAVARELSAAIGPGTTVLTTQNGIPWWYFHGHGGTHEGTQLESVDPGGVISANIPIDHVLGSVVYIAAEMQSEGVIRHVEGNRLSLSELDGSKSDRINQVSAVLIGAGLKAPVVSDIRSEIWTKLWGNLSFNPISALTHATLEDICKFPPTRSLVAEMMREAQTVGEAFGVRFRIPVEKRISGAESVGTHKTSMLQDIENGRDVEIDALLGSVIELGQLSGAATPNLHAIYALVQLLNKTLQREHGRLVVSGV